MLGPELEDKLAIQKAGFIIMGSTDASSHKFWNIREVQNVVSMHPNLIISL